MKAEIVRITPGMAAKFLKQNADNRPMRRSVVDGFKAALERGEYILTHQGIAFNGERLIDGQHRLAAIAEMPKGFGVDMLVSRGLPEEAARVMDVGLKRSLSDVLGESRRLVEAARFLAWVYLGSRGAITGTFLLPFIEGIRAAHADLLEFAPRHCQTWSSAPVRAAVIVISLDGGDIDHAKLLYRALVNSDFTSMPPVIQALYRANAKRAIQTQRGAGTDLFVRAMRAFDPDHAEHRKVQVKDTAPGLAVARSIIKRSIMAKA